MDMKILIVDDDENSRVFLERALLKQGYRVESVANGVQALARADHSPPQLIISDILMPELDGFELCRRVKTDDRLRGIPFVFYSATYIAADDRRLAMKLGASRFLIKPMELDDFLRMIRDVIREHQKKQLPVPDAPLAERCELNRMQMESLSRKLDQKVLELRRERGAREKAEQEYSDLKSSVKQLVAQAVAEERRRDDQLIIQGRQAFMGEMINNIAHQWRQPLNTLGLLAQDLQLTQRLGEFTPEFIDANLTKTMEVIRKMSRTIEGFSTFFRPEREKVEFRVLDVVSKVCGFVREGFKAGQIAIELEAPADPVVIGYPGEFSQVILNILMNARDALISRAVESPTITVAVKDEDGRAVVEVTDNGGGIPAEIIDKVFDPYFTTKGPDGGTGVGLFMSKSIIEKNMGGRLLVANAKEGARFRLELPTGNDSGERNG
ncbi:hybrid sensor histidine kinase/response regulator [Geomonas sp.]|uniref:hybrid sensor histidine kinase/response regulator n=1 Tax=Geomonas sp. TaxID=2651584 RepID=UPI002B4A5407|nr:hybrid sensor histidine kinase/response regulator [Geomonas sp.]HJV35744.1 hybrid sensor histidine kinase/response regulator [Geomonas sp.]